MFYQHLLKRNGCHLLAKRALNGKSHPLAGSSQNFSKIKSYQQLPNIISNGQFRNYHAIKGLRHYL